LAYKLLHLLKKTTKKPLITLSELQMQRVW